MTVVVKEWAARTPAINRIVVPEFPAFRGLSIDVNPLRPEPAMVIVAPLSIGEFVDDSMDIPSCCKQRSVELQSAPGA